MGAPRVDGRAPLPPGTDFLTRFWYNVPEQGDGCWEWTGSRAVDGYGNARFGRADGTWSGCNASRLAWILTHAQDLPGNVFVCHRCDNPPCVNPAHLFLGSNSDNIRDGFNKGRVHPPRHARLSESRVRQIHRRWVPGRSLSQVARAFGISTGHAHAILHGTLWPSVAMEFGRGPVHARRSA